MRLFATSINNASSSSSEELSEAPVDFIISQLVCEPARNVEVGFLNGLAFKPVHDLRERPAFPFQREINQLVREQPCFALACDRISFIANDPDLIADDLLRMRPAQWIARLANLARGNF